MTVHLDRPECCRRPAAQADSRHPAHRRAAGHRQAASPVECAVRRGSKRDPSRRMEIYTALSLDPPTAGSDLEAALPGAVRATPFRRGLPAPALRAGDEARCVAGAHRGRGVLHAVRRAAEVGAGAARLHQPQLHPGRGAAWPSAAPTLIVQKVARERGTARRLSLSCNNDTTHDTVDAIARAGPAASVAGGRDRSGAAVDRRHGRGRRKLLRHRGHAAGTVSETVRAAAPAGRATPTTPSACTPAPWCAMAAPCRSASAHWPMRCRTRWCCATPTMRNTGEVLQALDPELAHHPAVIASGGMDPFAVGLYGCSEMLNEGFKRLVRGRRDPAQGGGRRSADAALADGTANLGDQRAAGARRRIPAWRVLPGLARVLRLAAQPAR